MNPKIEDDGNDTKYNDLFWLFNSIFIGVFRSKYDSYGEVGLIQVTGWTDVIFYSVRRIDSSYDLLSSEMAEEEEYEYSVTSIEVGAEKASDKIQSSRKKQKAAFIH